MKRKIIQFEFKDGALYVLCEDGTMWYRNQMDYWEELDTSEIPEMTEEETLALNIAFK